MEVIDEEVHQILDAAAKSAIELLEKHRKDLQAITDGLVEEEELDRHQIADLIGPSVHVSREAELPDRDGKLKSSKDKDAETAASENSKSESSLNGSEASGSDADDSKESASESAAK